MNWLRKFMYGRYGGDNLSRALVALSFILLLVVNFLPRFLSSLIFIAYIPMILCIYRIFSRNIYRRQQENYKYLRMRNSIMSWFNRKLNRTKDLKTHKYFTCPNCKQKLRVPRNQGKISVTCPKCKNSFKGKS
ncbi:MULTISPECIES: hypothetical protein [unclassified Clostridium]|uniref:hypothetical protein n=1 Tax=unclassified Clostridium TaxID=2614128 RepID=UPI000297D2C4|nr:MULTISPECIES: hypothetical protein [unclassified Clostridium]EKQ50499.1 MAG: hypothetical protein A370_05503 [Clostridium sp. Maddingley MBC34-26]